MATETTPKRQRLPNPEQDNHHDREALLDAVELHVTRHHAPTTSVPVAGPSWRQFLFFQVSLLTVVSLLFGLVAYGFINRADASNGSTAAPAAAGAPMASMAPDVAHGGVPAAIPAGSVARLPLPKVAPPVGQRAATTVKMEIETTEVIATLDDGVTYEYWTFGGTVPGPMLRVRQGDMVELTLKNSPTSKAAHNIDLHAVTGPGGGAAVTMVQPGESKTFRFQAMNPGVYVYHCATPPVPHHISSGMYGLIVVEPPQGMTKVDREFYVMQGDMYLQGQRGDKGLRAFSNDKMLAEQPDYVIFNGSVGALTGDNALKANVGETVRIFFGVGGPNITSSFHVIGEIFDRVSIEGAWFEDPSKWPTNVQSTGVPTGGAAVVEFKLEVPGNYTLVDHSLGRAGKGAAGILTVSGPDNPNVFAPVK